MSNKKEKLQQAFSSFADQKLRILKAAKELEYQLAIARNQLKHISGKSDLREITDDPLMHFHFCIGYVLRKIRKHQLFHIVMDEVKTYTIKSTHVNENSLANSYNTLKAATLDLISAMRTEIDKSLFFHWQGSEPVKISSLPNWNAKYTELDVLADIVHVRVVEVPFIVS